MPAGNKSQLDMLGGGDIIDVSWATVATADLVKQMHGINAAFEQLHGYSLRHVWCNSTVIQNVLNNSKLQSAAGTANTVFDLIQTQTNPQSPEGIDDTGFVMRFRALPWLTWHVTDAGLEVDGTFTKHFPDDYAAFTASPDIDIAEMYQGSELVRTSYTSSAREIFGVGGWATPTLNPSGFELFGLDNALPVLYVPSAIAYAQVVF